MTESSAPGLAAAVHAGWQEHQRLLLDVIRPLSLEQLQLRPSPEHWAIWQLASNMVGARAYWMHDILGEGDHAIRDRFRMTTTTVPGLPLEDAGWEDDEARQRTADELVEAFEATWQPIDQCVRRWTPTDLEAEFVRDYGGRRRAVTRGWVVWHLVEHELRHGTEVALILRANGLPTLDI